MFVLTLIACGADDPNDKGPSSSTDPGATEPAGTGDPGLPHWTYLVSNLEVDADGTEALDLNNDGLTDNNMANALAVVDAFMDEDFSVPAFNVMLNEALYPDNVILFDAAIDDPAVSIAVLYGDVDEGGTVSVDQISYDNGGNPLSTLDGSFSSADAFTAGPSTISVPVTFDAEVDAVPITLVDVMLDGTLTEAQSSGLLIGVVPITEAMEGIIEPLIPEEGLDILGDDELETKEEVMEFLWGIVPALGDVQLEGDELGISAVFHYTADPKAF